MYIDTHAHLFLKDNPFEDFDPEIVFSDSLKAGVGQIWLVGTEKYDNLKNIEFAKKHTENVKTWVGFHPENYEEFDLTWLNQILKSEILNSKSESQNVKIRDCHVGKLDLPPRNDHVINSQSEFKRGTAQELTSQTESNSAGLVKRGFTDSPIVGIGEVGVDLNWNDKSTTKDQQQVFEDQIKLANKYNLPVTIHSRDAFEETLEVMQGFKNTKFVWHCFNLDKKQTEKTLSIFPNLYVGLNAIVTYKSGEYILQSLQQVPSSKLLIETDCPFLKPRQQLRSLGGYAPSKASSLGGQAGSLNSKSESQNVKIRDCHVGKLDLPPRNDLDSEFFKLKYNTPYGVIPVYNFVAEKLNISVKELEKLVEKNSSELLYD